jgi:hypothetical protein
MTCPPCTHDCREGRDCPLIAINAQVVGYVEPQRTWVGLTEERIREIWLKGKDHGDDWQDVLALARSFEAELKDRNN